MPVKLRVGGVLAAGCIPHIPLALGGNSCISLPAALARDPSRRALLYATLLDDIPAAAALLVLARSTAST